MCNATLERGYAILHVNFSRPVGLAWFLRAHSLGTFAKTMTKGE